MNYKSEIRNAALTHALRVLDLSAGDKTWADVNTLAEKIVEYLYIPDKDLESHLKSLGELLEQGADIQRVKDAAFEMQNLIEHYEVNQKRQAQLEVVN